MVRREPDRSRILLQIAQPQDLRLVNQHAKDSPATRKVADRRARLLVDSSGDEPLQCRARAVDHPKHGVARSSERRRGLDDPLEHHVERKLGADRGPRLEQRAQPIGVAGGRHFA